MNDAETLRFYAENAETYADHRTEPTGEELTAFLAALPQGARILELGCGNGRDAAYMLSLGFDVDATDGTPALAASAARRLGRPIAVLRFEDLAASSIYDGVWASASLLHVPATDLPDILKRIRLALRKDGVFTASYKAGTGEGRDQLGRYYNYPSPDQLLADYRAAGWTQLSLERRSGSGFDAKPTDWLWVTARTSAV